MGVGVGAKLKMINWEKPSILLVLQRALTVSMAFFLAAYLIVCVLVKIPYFNHGSWLDLNYTSMGQWVIEPYPGPFYLVALQHLDRTWIYTQAFPDFCFPGAARHSLEALRCTDLQGRVFLAWILILLPIVLTFYVFVRSKRVVADFYDESQLVLEHRKPLFKALSSKKRKSDERGFNFFEWFYLLKKIYIKDIEGNRLGVYVPHNFPELMPEDRFWVYEGPKALGAKRYIAVHHTPELKVIG